jgi:hypothetical protein
MSKVDYWVEVTQESRSYADAEFTAHKQPYVQPGTLLHVVEEYRTTEGVEWLRFDMPGQDKDPGYPETWVPKSATGPANAVPAPDPEPGPEPTLPKRKWVITIPPITIEEC